MGVQAAAKDIVMRISGHQSHGYVGLDIEDGTEVEQSINQWRILL